MTKDPAKKKSIPFLSTPIKTDFILAILLIPLWWILGIKFFIFHLIALLMFVKILRKKYKDKQGLNFPVESAFLIIFIAIYLVSFFLNLKNIPPFRAFASLYNLSFWIMGLVIIFVVYNSIQKKDLLALLGTFRIFGLICCLFVVLAYSVWILSHEYIRIKSLLSYFLPDQHVEFILDKAPLLESSLSMHVIGEDRLFHKSFPRTPVFNAYGPAFGATMLFLIVMTVAYYKTKRHLGLLLAVVFLESVAFILSLSRISVLALLLALLIVGTVVNLKRPSYRFALAFILIGLVITIILVPPQKILQTSLEFRKGSSRWRAKLYETTLNQSLKKPILGYGFKPRTEEFLIPVGSHSTYMSVLYRTGFLGLFVFALFWVSVLRRWWAQRKTCQMDDHYAPFWFYSGIAMIGGFLWMLTEDLDAPPVVAFIYFTIIGLIFSLNRRQNPNPKR